MYKLEAPFWSTWFDIGRTLLYDMREGAGSDELCDLFGVPASCLPEVRPTSGRFGVTAEGLPVPAGIPISGMAGDQQAALFGQACFEPGMTKNTYGTGSFILMNVGSTCPEPVEGLLTTIAWQLDGQDPVYALEGAIFVTPGPKISSCMIRLSGAGSTTTRNGRRRSCAATGKGSGRHSMRAPRDSASRTRPSTRSRWRWLTTATTSGLPTTVGLRAR